MGEQRRHLRVLVAIAVQVARAVRIGRLADAKAAAAAGPSRRRPPARRPSPPGPGSRGSKNGSGWATRTSRTPRHSFGVRSRVHTTIERTSTTSAAPNHARPEDREHRQPLERFDQPAPEERVVARVDLVHRGRVVGSGAEREVGQLLDRHADEGHQHEQDDLGDREIDGCEQPPHALADPGQDVRARGTCRSRWDDGRSRDGRLLDGRERRHGHARGGYGIGEGVGGPRVQILDLRGTAHKRAATPASARGGGRGRSRPDATPERRPALPAPSARPSPGPSRPASMRTSRRRR